MGKTRPKKGTTDKTCLLTIGLIIQASALGILVTASFISEAIPWGCSALNTAELKLGR